ADVRTERPDGLLQGDKIAIGNNRYEVAAFDPNTGDVVLRQPGAGRNYALPGIDLVPTSNLAAKIAERFPSPQHTLEIDGKTFYVKDGQIYGVHELTNDLVVIQPERELSLRPRRDLDSAEFISGGEFRRGKIREQAELDLNEARRTASYPIQNPEHTEVMIGNRQVSLENGQIAVGRQQTKTEGSVGDMRVSSNHGNLRWDAEQDSFVYSDHSRNGTWIKREGSSEFELVHGNETRIGANDE